MTAVVELPLKHPPETPSIQVLTPWGRVRLVINSPHLFYLYFEDFRVGRCWVTGQLRFRYGSVWTQTGPYSWDGAYKPGWIPPGNTARNRGKDPLVHRRLGLTPAQRQAIEELIPWIYKWVKRNRILFDLYDDWKQCQTAWLELQKDDPNERPW